MKTMPVVLAGPSIPTPDVMTIAGGEMRLVNASVLSLAFKSITLLEMLNTLVMPPGMTARGIKLALALEPFGRGPNAHGGVPPGWVTVPDPLVAERKVRFIGKGQRTTA